MGNIWKGKDIQTTVLILIQWTGTCTEHCHPQDIFAQGGQHTMETILPSAALTVPEQALAL
jgi:hypothetical protein